MTRPPSRHVLLALVGLAWAGTLVQVALQEIAGRQESADVRALVDSARLSRRHAAATYAIRIGGATVGSLRSAVSGGQHDEQLAYVIDGRLDVPTAVRLKGVVLAGWDRRAQRMVLEATWNGARHRIEGVVRDDAAGRPFEIEYVPPAGQGAREAEWVLPEAPILAPGPLPIPELEGIATDSVGVRTGAVPSPGSGAPIPWRVDTGHVETVTVAGRPRQARRHALKLGAYEVEAWTEPSGFPLVVRLPFGITIELVNEDD